MKTAEELIETLADILPTVAITISREPDLFCEWDGDGPDPANDGFVAYVVHVEAAAIVNGQIVRGRDTLCGSYYKYNEPIGMVHGYLPQMILEALTELAKLHPMDAIQYARGYLIGVMSQMARETTLPVAWQDTPPTAVPIAVNP